MKENNSVRNNIVLYFLLKQNTFMIYNFFVTGDNACGIACCVTHFKG